MKRFKLFVPIAIEEEPKILATSHTTRKNCSVFNPFFRNVAQGCDGQKRENFGTTCPAYQ
ncbi:hypothetical protein K8352_19045 [Flavobacteriaceae bacterium F89]|uniref:Uncharacterized protein n=1 Tax=Cerina litoralis TaxID=2874477 RepID=A0AAE3JST5_9FLAO|nr:hypothetical protein [Cerina litoralis]MCG2462868.1 hypothetical protein [Cerina litoralis]